MDASPFVKWAGGKTQLLRQYVPQLPVTFQNYVEPFVGGGAFFFHLHNQGILQGRQVLLSDSLRQLVDCYRVIHSSVEALIEVLQVREPRKGDAAYYYEVRAWDRCESYAERSDVERAAHCIFLHRTCYNRLYRVNQRGQFNVPLVRHSNPKVCDADNLRAVNRALRGVRLLHGDFGQCLTLAGRGDFVYLDPPYHPLSGTASFTSYTSRSFGAGDQQRLAKIFQELDRRGCQVMLSNSDTSLIRELYDGYEQVQVRAVRVINSKGSDRGAVPELLIMNRYNKKWGVMESISCLRLAAVCGFARGPFLCDNGPVLAAVSP